MFVLHLNVDFKTSLIYNVYISHFIFDIADKT